MHTRNCYIDFLRFVGLSLIVLAHVHSPNIIHQIRCCDVPLMLFVSGLAYGNRSINPPLKDFFLPRIKKLLIPVYLFVVCDLLAFVIADKTLSLESVIKSLFLCSDGAVGYVWIMKVFLLVMLVTPAIVKLNKRLSFLGFWMVVILLFIFQEALTWVTYFITKEPFKSVYQETLPYLVGYLIPFLIGVRLRQNNHREEIATLFIIVLCSVAALIIYLSTHDGPIAITPFYKYPPHSYFIIYGLSISTILWFLRRIIKINEENKLMLFIGRNTIWIYLWHIVFVTIANILIDNWLIKFFLVYTCAVGVYYIQFKTVTQVSLNHNNKILKYFIG